MSDFNLGVTSVTRLQGVDPDMIRVVRLGIKLTKIDFGIPADGGVRTSERQQELYSNGASEADGINNLSAHQSGEAVDFYAYVDGKASWREDHLAMVACAIIQAASILKVQVNWGGLWSSKKKTNGISYGWDMGHIEKG